MLVDLREHQPRPAPDTAEHLGWAAQVVVLRHLLHGDIEEQNLAGVASVCGYTAMAISNAQRQLVDVDLAVLRKVGRSKHLVFGESGPGIWKRALPLLRRPWRRRHPVTVEGKGPHTWIAGLDALARETMIASDKVATVAMAARDLRSSIADRTFTVCAAIDEADVLVEAWEYDPGRLAAGKIIDPLSLYLCLKDEPDERVQIALEQHMDALEW